MNELPKIYRGLNGIYVGETSVSNVEGDVGNLSYRGINIKDLVNRDFVEVCYLLLFETLPNPHQKMQLEDFLINHSDLNQMEVSLVKSIDKNLHPMKMLQAMVPLISLETEYQHGYSHEMASGLIVAAKIPSILAAFYQVGRGNEPITVKKGLSFNENFLYRFYGQLPSDQQVNILDVTQILQMEHSFNASTYASLVTASTLAPVECAIATAIGTLYGKLHGGADQAALEMAMNISSLNDVESFVLESLAKKQKIMGMGHREYKVVDPRAKILKPMARELCIGTPFENIYLILEKIEVIMGREMQKKGKDIKANVEFYKGPVFYALGIPSVYFTGIFAMSRVFGYLAHILASREKNVLIRPKAFYIGR